MIPKEHMQAQMVEVFQLRRRRHLRNEKLQNAETELQLLDITRPKVSLTFSSRAVGVYRLNDFQPLLAIGFLQELPLKLLVEHEYLQGARKV